MIQSSISYLWRESEGARGFTTDVWRSSHIDKSKENHGFISELSKDWNVLQPVIRWAERRCRRFTGINPDYARSYWTPPLTPRLAFDLERRQIEEKLQLSALVSLTDHDDIQAPMLLRTVAASRHIPVSVAWTVPFGETAFHLGVHNLPSAAGAAWMKRLAVFTAMPVETRAPKLLTEMLAELDE